MKKFPFSTVAYGRCVRNFILNTCQKWNAKSVWFSPRCLSWGDAARSVTADCLMNHDFGQCQRKRFRFHIKLRRSHCPVYVSFNASNFLIAYHYYYNCVRRAFEDGWFERENINFNITIGIYYGKLTILFQFAILTGVTAKCKAKVLFRIWTLCQEKSLKKISSDIFSQESAHSPKHSFALKF